MRSVRSLALVAVVALAAAACGSGYGGSGSTQTPGSGVTSSPPAAATGSTASTLMIGSDSANDHGEQDVTGKASVELEQDDFYFDPTVLVGSAGQVLTLEVKNDGSVPHTLTSDALGVDVTLQPGDSKTVKVTFPDSGFAEFWCSFHRSMGMVGELKVG